MALTFLNVLNLLQRRLREPTTVSVTTTAYSVLLGMFINDAKREVEDCWNWNCLRDSIIVTTVAGTRAYVLTNSRHRFRVLDVFNNTDNYFLSAAGSTYQTNSLIGSEASGTPTQYSFNGEYQGDAIIDLYPVPDAVQSINFNLVIPQADLAADADELRVPSDLVVLNAYMKAISERGEDMGGHYDRVNQDYIRALSNAISQDEARMFGETDWVAR